MRQVSSKKRYGKYGFTEAMRAADWQVFRQKEVTEPIYSYALDE